MTRGLSLAITAVLGGLLVAGCAGRSAQVLGAGGNPSPTATATPSASPTATDVYRPPGKATGRVALVDPKYGKLTVITSVSRKHWGAGCAAGTYLRVVDSAGDVLLRRDWNWGCGDLKPNQPAHDKSGNVFLSYNPGRYDGVIILRGAGGHLEDFGTLPRSGWRYQGSGPMGYYAKTVASQSGGALEIEQFNNDCNPSCAGGTTTHRFYTWNGHRYVTQGA